MDDGGLFTTMMKVYFNDYKKMNNIIKLIDHGPVMRQHSDWKTKCFTGFNDCIFYLLNLVAQNHWLANL